MSVCGRPLYSCVCVSVCSVCHQQQFTSFCVASPNVTEAAWIRLDNTRFLDCHRTSAMENRCVKHTHTHKMRRQDVYLQSKCQKDKQLGSVCFGDIRQRQADTSVTDVPLFKLRVDP